MNTRLLNLSNLNRDSQRLLTVSTILICIGIIMIYSASSCYAYDKFNDSAFYLKRHLVHTFIGIIFCLFFIKFDYRRLRVYSKPFFIIAFLGLIMALLPGIGYASGGAKRWINAGFVKFQPSEFAELFLIIYMADLLDRRGDSIKNFFYGFLPALIIMGLATLLILLQPDLGSAIALAAVLLIMMFVAGANMFQLLPFLVGFIPAFYYLIFKVPYRLKRIISYIDPWGDMRGGGFQIVQSFLALGSGGLYGVGLGASKQKLFYLPQAHTDFIFSIIGEELGIIGTIGIVVLFVLFIWEGIRISLNAKDLFGRLLALGITVSTGLGAAINIGVSTGAIPTKGLPLPFISYGGTSLVINIIGVGILINIANS